jgi:predicted DNA-binding transcriptional regulator AlpA
VAGDPDDLLTITEVITALRVSRSAFWRWRRRGTGPPVARLPGGAVRIRRADLAAWLAGRQQHEQEEGTAA